MENEAYAGTNISAAFLQLTELIGVLPSALQAGAAHTLVLHGVSTMGQRGFSSAFALELQSPAGERLECASLSTGAALQDPNLVLSSEVFGLDAIQFAPTINCCEVGAEFSGCESCVYVQTETAVQLAFTLVSPDPHPNPNPNPTPNPNPNPNPNPDPYPGPISRAEIAPLITTSRAQIARPRAGRPRTRPLSTPPSSRCGASRRLPSATPG